MFLSIDSIKWEWKKQQNVNQKQTDEKNHTLNVCMMLVAVECQDFVFFSLEEEERGKGTNNTNTNTNTLVQNEFTLCRIHSTKHLIIKMTQFQPL